MNSISNLKTFACHLGHSFKASLSVDLAALAAMPDSRVACLPLLQIQGRLQPNDLPQYRQWVADTYQTIANVARKTLTCALRKPDGDFLCIVCQPGQPTEFSHHPKP